MKMNPRILLAWLLSASLLSATLAPAATINVAPDNYGSGGCNLREAIQAANTDTGSSNCTAGSGTDTLVLHYEPGYPRFTAYNNTGSDEDNNVSGDLDIRSSIIIQGKSPSQSVIVGPTLDRAFDVINGSLTLNDVTVIGGSTVGATSRDGGVVNKRNGAILKVNRSVLRGGNAYYGGAIYAGGTGVLTVNQTTIQNNNAVDGGGVAAALQPDGDEAVFNNVTISGNTADRGGGIFATSGFSLHNATISRNRATLGGGIHYAGQVNTTTVSFANSLVIGNIDNDGAASDLYCFFSVQLGFRAYTMIGANPTCTFVLALGTPGTDARLSPLFDFGSGRPTHALLPGSDAIDAGNPNISAPSSNCLDIDARGVDRTRPCDLGAYEQHVDITVNSFNDFPDLNPGDGVCQATGNVCTLRAAAMEASASGGRWFVDLPKGTYTLSRAFNPNIDNDGGDLDVRRNLFDPPLQMTLMGMGDADDTRIVGGGFDRVLDVRGRSIVSFEYAHYPLAFALMNATISGGELHEDPFVQDPNAPLGGGGIRITGGKTLFYNVVVKDNHVESLPANIDSDGGGVYVDVRPTLTQVLPAPYATSSQFERFAIVDNSTDISSGGYSKYAGGLYAFGPNPYDTSDGIILNNGTIADNIGRQTGGARMVGQFDASFVSIINNSSEMTTYNAGGLIVSGQENRIRNVLIAGNIADGSASDCEIYDSGTGASLVSLGYNLIATAGAGCVISGDTTTNLLNVNPQLEARRSYAGMPFYAPAIAGPAVNAIPYAACTNADDQSTPADALGSPRKHNSANPACDIGAVEVAELPIFTDGFDP